MAETKPGASSEAFVFKKPRTKSRTAELIEQLELNYMNHRDELLLEDGFIQTPLKVLRDWAFEYSVEVEMTTFEIHSPRIGGAFDPHRAMNRVAIEVGTYQGDGQAPRYRLATQMAAADLLRKMAEDGTQVTMHGLPPGYRISSEVYSHLRLFAKMENLGTPPTYAQLEDVNAPDIVLEYPALHGFTAQIGYCSQIGASDSLFLAKRLAAKNLYELLSGEPYPVDPVYTGDECIKYDQLHAMGIKPVPSARREAKALEMKKKLEQIKDGDMDEVKAERLEDIYDAFDDDFGEDDDGILDMFQRCTLGGQREIKTAKKRNVSKA